MLEEPELSVFKACDSELRQSRTSFSIDSKVRLIWDSTMVYDIVSQPWHY